MSLARSSKSYEGVRAILPPDLQVATRNPTTADKAYVRGSLWLNKTLSTAWMWPGSGSWIALGSGAVGGVVTITGGSGGALSPTAGNFNILGTANQITSTGAVSTITLSLPAAVTAPGSLTTTTTLAAGTTVTAGTGIIATTGNITASTGNLISTLGSVSAATTVTAGTSITATLGDIKATNGNLVLGTAGNKVNHTSVATVAAAGANSIGSVVLVGGTEVVATTAVTTNSLIKIWRQTVGATGAAALGDLSVGTIINGTSFVINAWQPANATALQASDVSVIGWEIVN